MGGLVRSLLVGHPRQPAGPIIATVAEYDGRPAVRVSATQLGAEFSASQARKVVDGWCAFFATGPSPIASLEFTSRTPKRLFASLRGQTQLKALGVKWGDYEDLSALAGMHELNDLWLGGASSLRGVGPLAGLQQLRCLGIESLRHVKDLSPLASLTRLQDLEIGGDWMSARIAHVDSISFLRQLPDLERLVLHTIIADDLDYSPLLALTKLREIRVKRARGMKPSHDQLAALIPALEPIAT